MDASKAFGLDKVSTAFLKHLHKSFSRAVHEGLPPLVFRRVLAECMEVSLGGPNF
jgi:hypothetical protein